MIAKKNSPFLARLLLSTFLTLLTVFVFLDSAEAAHPSTNTRCDSIVSEEFNSKELLLSLQVSLKNESDRQRTPTPPTAQNGGGLSFLAQNSKLGTLPRNPSEIIRAQLLEKLAPQFKRIVDRSWGTSADGPQVPSDFSKERLQKIERGLNAAEEMIKEVQSTMLNGNGSRIFKMITGLFTSSKPDTKNEGASSEGASSTGAEAETKLASWEQANERLQMLMPDLVLERAFLENTLTLEASRQMDTHPNMTSSSHNRADLRKQLRTELGVERDRLYALYLSIAASLKKNEDGLDEAEQAVFLSTPSAAHLSNSQSLAIETAAQAAQIKTEIDEFSKTFYADSLIDNNLKKDLIYKAKELVERLTQLQDQFMRLQDASTAIKEMRKYNSENKIFDQLPDREARPELQTFIRLTKKHKNKTESSPNPSQTNMLTTLSDHQQTLTEYKETIEFEIEPVFTFKKSQTDAKETNHSFRALDRAQFGSRFYLLFAESSALALGLKKAARAQEVSPNSGLDFDPYFLLPDETKIYRPPGPLSKRSVWVPEDYFVPKFSEIELYKDRSALTETLFDETQAQKARSLNDFSMEAQRLIQDIRTKALGDFQSAKQDVLLTRITLDIFNRQLNVHFKDLSISRASRSELLATIDSQKSSKAAASNSSPYFSVTLSTAEFPVLDSQFMDFSLGHISRHHGYYTFERIRAIANRYYPPPPLVQRPDDGQEILQIGYSEIHCFLGSSKRLANGKRVDPPLVEALWAKEINGSIQVYVRARPGISVGKKFFPRILKIEEKSNTKAAGANSSSETRYEIDNYRGELGLWVPLEVLWAPNLSEFSYSDGPYLPLVRTTDLYKNDLYEVLGLSILWNPDREKRKLSIQNLARPSNIERILEVNSPQSGSYNEGTFRNRHFRSINR